MSDPPRDVDEYLQSLPADVRPLLTLDGRNLVSFAAWKNHIGVYPIPAGDDSFQAEIAPYRDAKATARFPLGEPIPYDLIARIATLLAAERGPA